MHILIIFQKASSQLCFRFYMFFFLLQIGKTKFVVLNKKGEEKVFVTWGLNKYEVMRCAYICKWLVWSKILPNIPTSVFARFADWWNFWDLLFLRGINYLNFLLWDESTYNVIFWNLKHNKNHHNKNPSTYIYIFSSRSWDHSFNNFGMFSFTPFPEILRTGCLLVRCHQFHT